MPRDSYGTAVLGSRARRTTTLILRANIGHVTLREFEYGICEEGSNEHPADEDFHCLGDIRGDLVTRRRPPSIIHGIMCMMMYSREAESGVRWGDGNGEEDGECFVLMERAIL